MCRARFARPMKCQHTISWLAWLKVLGFGKSVLLIVLMGVVEGATLCGLADRVLVGVVEGARLRVLAVGGMIECC